MAVDADVATTAPVESASPTFMLPDATDPFMTASPVMVMLQGTNNSAM